MKMLKKSCFSVFAIIAITGCSSSNNDSPYDEIEVSINGEYFGKTIDAGYENGVKLYEKKGDYVGFMDNDNVVYRSSVDADNMCGGEFVGLCESTGENICNISNYIRVTEVAGVSLIPPSMSFACGERL